MFFRYCRELVITLIVITEFECMYYLTFDSRTSISKSLHRLTGRRIIAFDARNHGGSEHTDTMSYAEMSTDIVELLQQQLNIKSAVLVGHSMGGRSVMYTALTRPEVVDRIVIVDISPVNQKFDVTDSTELNMSHFFHLLKSVRFQDNQPISKVRKDADAQLAKRLKESENIFS